VATSHDLIVIGGGSAGLGAARNAVVNGAKPLLVTDGPIGGDCTWTGCVPSKTLIAQSKQGIGFEEAIATVHDAIEQIASAENADVLRREGIDVVEGRGHLGAPGEVVVGTSRFRANNMLPNEEPDASVVIESAMRAAGVNLQLGSFVSRAEQRTVGIELQVGTASTAVDTLLIAAGRTPNTEGLGLEQLDIDVASNGHIIVDERLQTSVDGIRAAGDVTGLLPFTHSADEQGRMATAHALGLRAKWKYDASTTPWVTFTTPEVARVGVTEREAPTGARVAHLPLHHVDRAITEGKTDGFVKLIAGPKPLTRNMFGGQIVGATIVAERAGEMIHGPTLAARLGMFVGRLAQVTVPYPTWTTAIQQAAGMFFQPMNGIEARPVKRN